MRFKYTINNEYLHFKISFCRNNAGKFSYDHGVTEDGIEMTFATNYLGILLFNFVL